MALPVNTKKSILRNRVCFTGIFNKINPGYYFLIFPILLTLYIIKYPAVMQANTLGTTISLALAFALPLIIIRISSNARKMERVKNFNPAGNEELLISAAKEFNWMIASKKDNCLVFSMPRTIWGPSSQVTFIYDNNDLLINIVTFGKAKYPSLVYSSRNRNHINFLAGKLEELKNKG